MAIVMTLSSCSSSEAALPFSLRFHKPLKFVLEKLSELDFRGDFIRLMNYFPPFFIAYLLNQLLESHLKKSMEMPKRVFRYSSPERQTDGNP